MFSKIWRLLLPFRRVFGWFLVLIVIYEGLQIIEGYTVSLMVRLHEGVAQWPVWVAFMVGLLVFSEVFMRLDNALDWHIISRQGFPVFKHLKIAAITKFLSLSIPWHRKQNSGALVGKVANGVSKVAEIVDVISWEFVPTTIQTFLSMGPLIWFSPMTALDATLAFIFFMVLTFRQNRERKPLRKSRYDLYETEWHKAVETVQAVETNLMFGQKERALSEQVSLHDQIINFGLAELRIGIYKYNRWRIRILYTARILAYTIWAIQLSGGKIDVFGWQIFLGTMDVPSLIFVATLSEKLFSSFWRIARLFDRASEASEGAERLANLMAESSTIRERGETPKFPDPVGITMTNVCFAYEGDYSEASGALHDFCAVFPPGKIVAVVGPSGGGKTTLRKVMTGQYDIQAGKILVGGFDVATCSNPHLVRLFSYVPQGDDVFIFSENIAENIARSKPNATQDEIVAASRLAGIHEFVASLPEGYETQVGERGKRLSGGQKQRVALARAILANRPILILDEATSAVDAITEKEIQSQMRSILAGKTAIIIAHRLATIWDIADKIIVVDQGRKVEEGTHKQLTQLDGLYAKMVALQTAN